MMGTSFRQAGQGQPLLEMTFKQRTEMMSNQPPEELGKTYSGQRDTKFHSLEEKQSSNVQWVGRARIIDQNQMWR